MPRLIGKQSNSGWYVGSAFILAIAIVVACEYTGLINIIPGFGREYQTRGKPHMEFRG
ncbi:MAG: hypothetical protein WBA57_12350 [Elainellaceae cyanobacterium]